MLYFLSSNLLSQNISNTFDVATSGYREQKASFSTSEIKAEITQSPRYMQSISFSLVQNNAQ